MLRAFHTRFGTTSDEDLVDPAFPRRFVPRAFDAIIRNRAHELLPTFMARVQARAVSAVIQRAPEAGPAFGGVVGGWLSVGVTGPVCRGRRRSPFQANQPSGPDAMDVAAPVPTDLATCTAVLAQTRTALADTRRQRDALKAAVAAINASAAAATSTIAMM